MTNRKCRTTKHLFRLSGEFLVGNSFQKGLFKETFWEVLEVVVLFQRDADTESIALYLGKYDAKRDFKKGVIITNKKEQ